MKTTSKKQKFVDVRTFTDNETGEIIPMQVTEITDKDFNFHKLWLRHFIDSLDKITNKRIELAYWILDNLDNENKLIATQRTIAEKTKISLDTVRITMKALQEGEPPFLIKIQSGVYQVNPEIIWKGSHGSRMGVCYNYKIKK